MEKLSIDKFQDKKVENLRVIIGSKCVATVYDGPHASSDEYDTDNCITYYYNECGETVHQQRI